jgi:hypothetical protein
VFHADGLIQTTTTTHYANESRLNRLVLCRLPYYRRSDYNGKGNNDEL